MIEAVYMKEQIVEGENEFIDEEINDKASGLYSTFFSIGQIIAPIMGGPLYEAFDSKGTCDFLGVICCIYTVFYFIFNVGFDIFK